MRVVLSIAGSDSSGGAGIQADLKTMTANGVYGMTAISAMTAQNTMGVTEILESSPEFLDAQIKACLSDIPADAVKIGMLPSPKQVEIVAANLREFGVKILVVDPVMIATSGSKLMGDSTSAIMEKLLFPITTVITPNILEAQVLAGKKIENELEMEAVAKQLSEKYGCAVLLKGGHAVADANDVLVQGGVITWFHGKRIDNPNTHGTGCTLSSAIAANLAKGFELQEAVGLAKDYLTRAIEANLNLGHGHGPLNHMV